MNTTEIKHWVSKLCVCVMVLLLGISGTGLVVADDNGPLRWETQGIFTPPKYFLGSGQSGQLLGDDGLSEDFKQILSPYPEALAEAKRAEAAQPMTMMGSVIILAGTVVLLKDTLDQADDPLGPEPDYSKSLGLVIVGAVVTLIGSSSFKGHVNESIRLYNRAVSKSSSQGLHGALSYADSGKATNSRISSTHFRLGIGTQQAGSGAIARTEQINLFAMWQYQF